MIRVNTLGIIVLLSLAINVQAEKQVKTAEMAEIEVYRSPTCGCCSRWLDHLKKNQFKVIDHVTEDVELIKKKVGVSANLASCHTGLVNGYVIEGHVPAIDIKKLLKQKPSVLGLSVPGMPVGTPGMEMGAKIDPYQVVSFDKDGNTKVFTNYEGK